ncbi:unnamed protein product [Parajaminaea phylloscopi]
MAAVPPVELFTTSILSNHKVRHRHERFVAVFAAKKVDYVYHDLASDEDAKKRFRRKALDPQIPNVLVHNEWRGTFEEFEEAVEFGELDLFLRIDPARATGAVAGPSASAQADLEAPVVDGSADAAVGEPASNGTSTSDKGLQSGAAKIPAAPAAAPTMAPEGSGAGPERNSMDEFLDSLSAWKPHADTLSDADLSALLDEGESANAKKAFEEAPKAPKPSHAFPGDVASSSSSSSAAVKRTYFPSEDAGVRPLRLPKMGNAARAVSSPVSSLLSASNSPTSSSDIAGSRRSPSQYARFSASQNSSRALAAEASASTSTRVFSAKQVRAGLDSGKRLQEVLGQVQETAHDNRRAGFSGEADGLLEELGLSDLKLTDEQAEAFLLSGQVPEGMEVGGTKLQRGGTLARKARDQEAARDVADRARNLADERRQSASVAKERRERANSSQTLLEGRPASVVMDAPAPADMSSRTKEVLERAKEKRASRQLQAVKSDAVAVASGELVEQPSIESSQPNTTPSQPETDATTDVIADEDAPTQPSNDAAVSEADGEATASKEPPSETIERTEVDSSKTGAFEDAPTSTAQADKEQEAPTPGDSQATTDTPDGVAQAQSQDAVDVEPTAAAQVQESQVVQPVPGASKDAVPSNHGESQSARTSERLNGQPHAGTPLKPASASASTADERMGAATPSTDEEEIDELLARLSGLGAHRLSAIVKPLPDGDDALAVKLDPLKEEIEEASADTLLQNDKAGSEHVAAAAAAAAATQTTEIPHRPATPPLPAPPHVPSANHLSPPALTLPDGSGGGRGGSLLADGSEMNRSESSTSSSSAASSKHLRGLAAAAASSSSTTTSMTVPGARKGMDIQRKSSGASLSLSPPLPSSSSSSSGNPLTLAAAASPTNSASSPRSPRLKARFQKSFGSLGRKSTSSSSGHGSIVSSPPLAAAKAAAGNNGPSSDRSGSSEWRSQRTLSQILRDADEALAEAGGDGTPEGDSDDGGGLDSDGEGGGSSEIRI